MGKDVNKNFIRLLEDSPVEESDNDILGFNDYAPVIADSLIASDAPLTFGIFGEWGSGKTSLMRLIESYVKRKKKESVITVWFNFWQYESESHPILPLCASIINSIKDQENIVKKSLTSLKEALKRAAYSVELKAKFGIQEVAQVEVGFNGEDIANRSNLLDDKLLNNSLYYGAFEKLHETTKDIVKEKIIVFIDDLDRCLPKKAVKLLESVKLILNQPNFAFIFGLDRKTISSFFGEFYDNNLGDAGEKYLDKIFQVSFFIPDYSEIIGEYARRLIVSLVGEKAGQAFQPLFPVVGTLCKNNPRAVKRFLNNILIDKEIVSKRQKNIEIPLIYFGFVRALQMHWEVVAEAIRSNGGEIRKTLSEKIYIGGDDQEKIRKALTELSSKSDVVAPVYRRILRDQSLFDILISKESKQWLLSEEHELCWTLQHEISPMKKLDELSGNQFFHKEWRGVITDRDLIYDAFTRSERHQKLIRKTFPEGIYDDIIKKSDSSYWEDVNWHYLKGSEGSIIGKLTVEKFIVFLMMFQHQGESIYLFIQNKGVEIL